MVKKEKKKEKKLYISDILEGGKKKLEQWN